jgi:FkbH-like protein
MNPAPTTEEDLLAGYIQADAPGRRERFPEFLKTIKRMAGEGGEAADWARRAVSPDLDYSSLLSLRKVIRRQRTGPGPSLRLAVLGGPTTTQLVWLIDAFLAASGIEAEIWEGEYGTFRQALLLPDPGLEAFRPQLLFLATGARDVAALPAFSMDSAAVEEMAHAEFAEWSRLWRTAHERWGCQIIQNTFDASPWDVVGHLANRLPTAKSHYLARLNRMFAEQGPAHVLMHDLQAVAMEAGRSWFDPRFYHDAKMPCGPESLVPYAHSVSSILRAVLGKSRKVLVLDLDNTLWGGVIGDDGLGGIRFGQGSAEGESYLAFQRYVKELSARGVLLAVCSKNQPENAREPFEKHPEMLLRLGDFACFVANWNNKADNLRAIAKDLNLGIDSLVFVDDNPAERAVVRRFVPEVAVPDLPEDPAGYVEALARHRYFEVVSLTGEDLQRSRYYAQDRQRAQLRATAADMDGFLASLDMTSIVEPLTPVNLDRATQLINKSNQFNLTTRRHTLAETTRMAASDRWVTLTLTLRDKFGDNGLIAVVLGELEGEALRIDTWVMSCRVLMRGMERFTLNCLCEAAARKGAGKLVGHYRPTAKNGMVKDHYENLGFARVAEAADGATTWERPLGDGAPPFLTHIRMQNADPLPT